MLLTIAGFFAAFWIRKTILPDATIYFYSHIFIVPLLLFLVVAFLSYFNAYDSPRNQSVVGYAWSVFRALSISIGILLALLFFLQIDYISRSVVIIFFGIEFILIFSSRFWLRSYYIRSVKNGSKALHVLIIGTGDRAKELSTELRKQAEWGVKVIGHLDPDPTRIGQEIIDAPVIGTIDDISTILKKHVIDEVIIAIPRSLLKDAEHIALACEEEGIKLQFMAAVFSLHLARIGLTNAGNIPLLTLEPVAQDEIKLLCKQCFDFTVTLLSMPIVLPIILIIALAVKIDSRGPAIFCSAACWIKKAAFPFN